MKVTAKRKDGPEVEVDVDFPENLAELTSSYGDAVVYNHARGSIVVALQGWLRGQLDAKKTPAEIQAAVKEWKPGQRKQGKSPAEKVRESLGKLSPEARAALLKEFKNAAKAAGAQA